MNHGPLRRDRAGRRRPQSFVFAAAVGAFFVLAAAPARATPPVAVPGPNQAVNEGASVTLNGSASYDPDGFPIIAYSWQQLQGPAVALTNPNGAITAFAAPPTSTPVNLVFRLTVVDLTGESGFADVVVTDNPLNRPPTANAGPDQTIDEGTTGTLNGSASSDPEGQALTYAWTQTAGPAVAIANANTAIAQFAAPLVNANTVFTFQLTVTDPLGASSTDSVNVTVRDVAPPNRPPVANAGPDQNVQGGAAVGLNGSGSFDPEGAPITYAWTQIGGPAVALTGAASPTPSFTAPIVDAPTALTFRLTVTDPAAASGTDDVVVTVTKAPPSNHPPVANAGPHQTVSPQTVVVLNGDASSDPDGDALTFQWSQLTGPAVTLSNAGTSHASFVAPSVSANVTFAFRLTVRDPAGASAIDDTNVVVTNGPSPEAGAGGLTDLALYPNPFTPAVEEMKIRYRLASPSDVTVVISDAFGHLVQRIERTAGESGGAQDLNIVNWDGKNGDGDWVGNGAYNVQVIAHADNGTFRARDKAGVKR